MSKAMNRSVLASLILGSIALSVGSAKADQFTLLSAIDTAIGKCGQVSEAVAVGKDSLACYRLGSLEPSVRNVNSLSIIRDADSPDAVSINLSALDLTLTIGALRGFCGDSGSHTGEGIPAPAVMVAEGDRKQMAEFLSHMSETLAKFKDQVKASNAFNEPSPR